MVIVTFKDDRNKLVNFFVNKFKTVADAKLQMEKDAMFYAIAHGGLPKWVNPKNEDYLEVEGTDGCTCVWQYCEYLQGYQS